jgi:hypothetical protein
MMLLALKGSQPPRRLLPWVQLVGALVAILYGVVGVYGGLAQQRSGLAPSEIDCGYRTRLIRDRVIALTERSPAHSADDPQPDVVSKLIRETLAACSDDAESVRRLESIDAHLHAHVERRALDIQARHELLAP